MRTHNKKINGCLELWTVSLLISGGLQAATPVWTYSAPSPRSVTISHSETATVQYTLTNQSHKPKDLILKATPGLSASPCHLAKKGSVCAVTLTIQGSLIPKQGIHAGPVFCEQGNSNQCYQPSQANSLDIRITQVPPVTRYTVTPLAGAYVSQILPSGVQSVEPGSTAQFTVSAESGYAVEEAVGGTCPFGQWSGAAYTTGAIFSNCTVSFTAILQEATISVAPQTVTLTTNAPGNTQVITVTNHSTSDYAHHVVADVSHTGGALSAASEASCASIPLLGTCTITLTANSMMTATHIAIQGNNTNATQVVVTVDKANLSVNPANIQLTTDLGSSVPLTVTNNGPVDAYNLEATVLLPEHGVVISNTTCSPILGHTPPNNTCTFDC